MFEEQLLEAHPGLPKEEFAASDSKTQEEELDIIGSDKFAPARCPVLSCKSIRTFKSHRVLKEHRFEKHSGLTKEEIAVLINETQDDERVEFGLNSFIVAYCPVKSCNSTRDFRSYRVLMEHFVKKHPGLTKKERAAMISKTQDDERVVSGDDDVDNHDA